MLTPIQVSYTIDTLGRKRPKGRPSNWLLCKPKEHGWPKYNARGIAGIYGITKPIVSGVGRAYNTVSLTKKTRNKFEASIERQLKRAKARFSYETEKIPYVLAGHYIPDFIISTPTGRVFIECKGYLRPEHKRKMVAVKRQHPNLDIRIVFYRGLGSNIRWAERHGFRFAIEKIPVDWLEGL